MKHTQIPWKVVGISEVSVVGEYGSSICSTVKGKRSMAGCKANAEFIVRACNAHDELMETLKAVTKGYEYILEMRYGKRPFDVILAAKEAIKKAEGEQ